MSEENKALVRRFYEEIWNKGNLAAADELLAANFVNHSFPEIPKGPEGFKQVFKMWRSGFPDLQMTVEDMVAEGDKVACRLTSRATHKGEFMGIAATGKQVTSTSISIQRVAGGKLVESWVEMDRLGMMQQIGVIPRPGQPKK